jgi:hypothetical protein
MNLASAIADRYLTAWNERDAGARRNLVGRLFALPGMPAAGHVPDLDRCALPFLPPELARDGWR